VKVVLFCTLFFALSTAEIFFLKNLEPDGKIGG